ncbi:hypothetical protein [Streptomyces hundungensis]|uniref:hypothetical protein n=1 Tax=Streptomyces hundungensis TaxID=1077946 RepID=UPI0033F189B7
MTRYHLDLHIVEARPSVPGGDILAHLDGLSYVDVTVNLVCEYGVTGARISWGPGFVVPTLRQ